MKRKGLLLGAGQGGAEVQMRLIDHVSREALALATRSSLSAIALIDCLIALWLVCNLLPIALHNVA